MTDVKVTGPKGGTVAKRVPASRLGRLVPGWLRRFAHLTLSRAKTPPAAVPKRPLLPFFGLDYETGPSPAELRAAGVHFVARYLSTPGNPKNLTRAEATALRKAGIDVVLVFETVADRALAGRAAGVADARSAVAQAHACGAPTSARIYFAVDFDARGAQLDQVLAYIRGAASELSPARTGVYGGAAAVKTCLDAKACALAWQTLAWSDGEWDPRAQLRQISINNSLAGHQVDHNHAVKAAYGQWPALKGASK